MKWLSFLDLSINNIVSHIIMLKCTVKNSDVNVALEHAGSKENTGKVNLGIAMNHVEM